MKDFDIRKILPGAAPQPAKKPAVKAPTPQTDFNKALESATKSISEMKSQADTLNAEDVSATRAIAEQLLERSKPLIQLYQRLNAKDQDSE